MSRSTLAEQEVQFEFRWKAPPTPEGLMNCGPANCYEALYLWGHVHHFTPRKGKAEVLAKFRKTFAQDDSRFLGVPDSELVRLLTGKVDVERAEGGEVIRFRLRVRHGLNEASDDD
jgi:hypothetical protein